jgi:hypothetical protein
VNATDTDEIAAYVEAVREALAGLPESTRTELLEDLPEHLAEVAADGIGTLTERLGPPSVYAAELLASAGYVGGFPDPPPSVDRFAELREVTVQRLRILDAKAGPLFGYARASEFLVLLRPAWWVLRGYLAAMVVAMTLDSSGQPIGLLPRIGGSEIVALLLLAAGILASIWLGRRSPRLKQWPRYALWAGSAVLVLVALGGFAGADSSSRNDYYTDVQYDNPYSHIQDVFVYDEQGRLIEDARLFDQDGQPIRLGDPYCTATAEENPYGDSVPAEDDSTYPFCADNAPFRVPPVDGLIPSAVPSESALPAPADSVAPAPAESAVPQPSAS